MTAYLPDTGTDETSLNRSIHQGIAVVWDQEEAIEGHNGPCGDQTDPTEYVGSNEQDTAARNDPGFPSAGTSEEQTAFIMDFVPADNDGWTTASGAVIPARDGDTLTITVAGVSGSIRLVVDGDEPEIEDISPASGGTQNKTTVNLGFTVSDDGSGIRYDGESGASGDPDLQPQNGDSDQRFDEPITSMTAADGAAPRTSLSTSARPMTSPPRAMATSPSTAATAGRSV